MFRFGLAPVLTILGSFAGLADGQNVLHLGFCAYNEDPNDPPPWPAVVAVARKSFESTDPIVPLPGTSDFTVEWHMAYAESSGDSIEEGMRRMLGNRLDSVDHEPVQVVVGCGGSSTSEAVAPLGASLEIPLISWWAGSPTLSNKLEFPFFLRTRDTSTSNGQYVARLCSDFGWERIGFIYEEQSFHIGVYEGALAEAQDLNISVTPFKLFTYPDFEDIDKEIWKASLSESRNTGLRVFGLSVAGPAGKNRIALEVAREVGLNMALIIAALELADFFPSHPLELRTSFNGMLGIDQSQSGQNSQADRFEQEWKSMTFDQMTSLGIPQEYVDSIRTNRASVFIDSPFIQFQAYLFDAIMAALIGFQRVLDGGTPTNSPGFGQLLLDALYGVTFSGPSGDVSFSPIVEGSGGDRGTPTFTVFNVQDAMVTEIGKITAIVQLVKDPVFPNGGNDKADYDALPECPSSQILVISDEGFLECGQCERGEGVKEEENVCANCTPGKYGPERGAGCLECGPGSFTDGMAATECTPCRAGTFQTSRGQTSCEACPPGYFSDESSSSCRECQAGSYAADEGSSACTLCEVGQYNSRQTQTSCISCGTGHTYPQRWSTLQRILVRDAYKWVPFQGAKAISECGCTEGMQLYRGECLPCDEGMICAGMGEVYLEPGYATDFALSSFKCHGNGDRCPGGSPGLCAQGRLNTSVACSDCEDGKTPGSDGTCVECSGSDILPLVVVVIAGIGVLVTMYMVIDKTSRATQRQGLVLMGLMASQMVTLLQYFGVIADLAIDWTDPLSGMLSFMDIFSFNISIFHPSCISGMTALARYAVNLLGVFVCFLIVLCIHFLTVIFRYNRNWGKAFPSLVGVLGTVVLTFNVSIVATMLAPLQCNPHPNGKRTISRFPSTLCWEGGDQVGMIVMGLFSMMLPVGLIAVSCWASWQFPKRMGDGDLQFLRAFCFLFYRFTPQAYWYGPVILMRSLLVGSVPVLQDTFALLIFLQIFMTLSLCIIVGFRPWRQSVPNGVDCASHFCMIIFVTLALSIAGTGGSNAISTASTGFLIGSFVFLPLAGSWAIYLRFIRSSKRFRFFLCHHKAATGAFARTLKTYLLSIPSVTRAVFLDTDDLQDLGSLFGNVGNDSDTLVVCVSNGIWLRHWCIGEVTTAYLNKVQVVLVMMAEGKIPSTAWIDDIDKHTPEILGLTEYGMATADVKSAMHELVNHTQIRIVGSIGHSLMDELAKALAGQSPSKRADNFRIGPLTDPMPATAQTVILTDSTDLEAVACGLMLRKLMLPRIGLHQDWFPFVLPPDEKLPKTAKCVLLVCSSGIFQQRCVLNALLDGARQSVSVVPIVSDELFRFPTKELLLEQLPVVCSLCDEPDAVSQIILDIFMEIAVVFQPSVASEIVLDIKAREVASRLLTTTRRKLEVSRSFDAFDRADSGRYAI